MKAERLALFGVRFPRGFQSLSHAIRVSHDKLNGLPKSYFPRAPKDGEHLIRVDVDPNGIAHGNGDIILNLPIASKAIPGLTGDWEIVQARPAFSSGGNDSAGSYRRRYLLVRPATEKDSFAAKTVAEVLRNKVMDWGMNS